MVEASLDMRVTHGIQSVEGLLFITQTLQMYEIKGSFQGPAMCGVPAFTNNYHYETYDCFAYRRLPAGAGRKLRTEDLPFRKKRFA
jgi:hypothetical protein